MHVRMDSLGNVHQSLVQSIAELEILVLVHVFQQPENEQKKNKINKQTNTNFIQ